MVPRNSVFVEMLKSEAPKITMTNALLPSLAA